MTKSEFQELQIIAASFGTTLKEFFRSEVVAYSTYNYWCKKPKAESKPQPLPHEQRSRLTPGEIEAIKKVRANPHIPDDAKPELPEGYSI